MKHIYLIVILIVLARCTSRVAINEPPMPAKINKVTVSQNIQFQVTAKAGTSHNHPSFVFWLEDENGDYIETLFITQSVGTANFTYGDASEGKWKQGARVYPASIPYWSHKRGIKNSFGSYVPGPDNPLPDAVTGATPKMDFTLQVGTSIDLPQKFRLMFEVNQTWDFNEYWTNNKYPDDADYKSSCQPSVIYEAEINLSQPDKKYTLKPIGHGHYSGDDGSLNSDLSTLTTALSIFESVWVEVIKE